MNKFNVLVIFIFCLMSSNAFSQQNTKKTIQPAAATVAQHNALYVLNQSDDKKVKGFLRNIGNVLNDPRLKGKLHIEVIAFSDGVELYKKSGEYEALLVKLKEKGVVFLQCENTLEQRKIGKEELFSFVEYVPSGNGQIILRHYEGWAVVHP